MDIQDLRIFARVAAVNNLSAVANELGLTTGTISKRIQSLEGDLKARLFDRTTRSIRLTDEGRTLLGRVERVLIEMDLAQDEIVANGGRPSGRLRISAPASLSRRLVAPALVRFVDAYPDIDVRVDITDRVVNLHEEGYDAAIRSGTLTDSSLKAKRLAADRMILVAAPRYIERHGAPRKPAELAQHSCLVHGDQQSWTLHRGHQHINMRVTGRLNSDSGAFLHIAALDGVGILRASEIGVADDISAGRLVRVMTDYELATNAGIWAVYPNAKHEMPRLRALLDHLAETCRDPRCDTLANDTAPLSVLSKKLAT